MVEAYSLVVAVEEHSLYSVFKEELHVVVQIVKHRVCLNVLLEQVVPYIHVITEFAPRLEPFAEIVVVDYIGIGYGIQAELFVALTASELVRGAAAVRRKGHTDTGTCGSYAGRLSSHVREYEIRKTFVLLAYLFVDAVCKAHDGTGCRAVFFLHHLHAVRAVAIVAVVSLCKIDELKINADDRSGGEFVFDILKDAVSDVADHIFIRVADLLIVNIVVAPSVAREAVMCLCYRTVGILRSRGSSSVGRKTRCNGRLTLILSVNMLECGRFGFLCIGGDVDVIGFGENGLTVAADSHPIKLILEETVYAVHASALHRAFDYESVALEEVAVAVVL